MRPHSSRGCRWNDPAFAIEWPLPPAVISARDAAYPLLERAGRRVMPDKRVLVSGAGGFIGRWSVPALLQLGVRSPCGAVGNIESRRPRATSRREIHVADLLDGASGR